MAVAEFSAKITFILNKRITNLCSLAYPDSIHCNAASDAPAQTYTGVDDALASAEKHKMEGNRTSGPRKLAFLTGMRHDFEPAAPNR